VEIRQGLESGERIIVDGTGKLRPGLKVAAREVPAVKAPQPEAQPLPGAGGSAG